MKTNSIVKIIGSADEGSFKHVGRVIASTDTDISIRTIDGEMTFDVVNVEVKAGRTRDLPAGFDEAAEAAEAAPAPTTEEPTTEAKEPKAKKVKEPKADAGPTKKERAIAILRSYKDENGTDMPRKEALTAFQEQLAMSKHGASTYFHNVRHFINDEAEAAEG